MRTQWCWKCKAVVPMLDEGEYATVTSAMRHLNEMSHLNEPEAVTVWRDRIVTDNLRRLLGPDVDLNALMSHLRLHRLSACGPPCPRCQKTLRTPVASKCFECGYVVRPSSNVPMPSGTTSGDA